MAGSVRNALSRYYPRIFDAMRVLHPDPAPEPGEYFQPDWELPELTPDWEEFLSPSGLWGAAAGEYRGRPVTYLDLAGNPRTRTTKTFGSALIVARAVAHADRTGEPVLLVTPSAANKAVALREAVLRAYETGVAAPDRLRVAAVVPESNLEKLWASPLSERHDLARANPLGVFAGPEREHVKVLTTEAVRAVGDELRRATGFRVWYTLDPDNYMIADAVRAFFEYDELPAARPRWHAHAVSSAYGLLGHDLGRRVLGDPGAAAHYLLVQHLETPDLVVRLHPGPPRAVPRYRPDPVTGRLCQPRPQNPRFPATCYAVDERLERTFYTRRPPTTPRVQELLRRRGGDGIVVSLHECLERYHEVRRMLGAAGMDRLPADPRRLREWAVVMAATGALTAIDRDLVPAGAEVLLHGSGTYSEGEFTPPDRCRLRPVAGPADVAALLRDAAGARV